MEACGSWGETTYISGFFGWGVYTNLSFTDTKFVSVILKKGTMALGSTSLPFLPKPSARPLPPPEQHPLEPEQKKRFGPEGSTVLSPRETGSWLLHWLLSTQT